MVAKNDSAVSKTVEDTSQTMPDTGEVEEAAANLSVGATDVAKAIAGLNDPDAAFYTSIKGGDFADRIKVTKALTSSEPLDDHKGETINLRNVIVLPVDLANEAGEVNTAPRVIFVDEEGNAFHATSVGLLSFVTTLFSTIGEPETWPSAVPVKVVEKRGRNGYKYFTCELV